MKTHSMGNALEITISSALLLNYDQLVIGKIKSWKNFFLLCNRKKSLLMRMVDFTKANPLGNKTLKSGIGLKSPKAKKLFNESESETEHSSPENQKPERQTSQLISGERAKVNILVELSSYSGQKGKARVFVRDFWE